MKTQDTEKNLFFVSKHHVSTQGTIISSFPSTNQNSINIVLIKRPTYGFNNSSESLKKLDSLIGFFISPVNKENKLLIKLLTLLKIKKLDLKFSIKPFLTWKMLKGDLSFTQKKAERCKFTKYSSTQYFLIKAHIKAQHSKM